jgi:hypothetical protein
LQSSRGLLIRWYSLPHPYLDDHSLWPAIKNQIRQDQNVTAFWQFFALFAGVKPMLFGHALQLQWEIGGAFRSRPWRPTERPQQHSNDGEC